MGLGKTALQKIIFLLERVFGFDCDYVYTLYTDGPYCADVSRDLDIVEGFDGAEIQYDFAYGGCHILPSRATDDLRGRAADFLGKIRGSLDRLISDYGRVEYQGLQELRSTIIYLAKPNRDKAELVLLVHSVKPHFSESQIEAAVDELDEKDYFRGAITTCKTLTAAN